MEFKVGDWVVGTRLIDDRIFEFQYELSELRMAVISKDGAAIGLNQLRHATPAEIKAGRRLGVSKMENNTSDMGDDAHIENHISPLCISDLNKNERQTDLSIKKMHELKTDPEMFQAVVDGIKTFEIRFNDRDFQIGDQLILKETVHTRKEMIVGKPLIYTGRTIRKTISYVLDGYGLKNEWVILGIVE